MATRVFTDEEIARLRSFPEISREELIRFFTLTAADVEFNDPGRGRGPADRLGLAVQLCALPWLGFVPADVALAPPAAVARLSERLRISVGELARYGSREQTRSTHPQQVARYLGWRSAGELERKELEEFLLARAMEHDSPSLLFRLACEHLISSRVIRPGVVTLLERVAAAHAAAGRETHGRVTHLLTPALVAELDNLLLVDAELGTTRLTWLTTPPVSDSPESIKNELAKLAFLRGMDAHTLDVSVLPVEHRRFLASVGRRLTAQSLDRREPQRHHPILLTLVSQCAVEVLDDLVALFDQAVSAREGRARRKLKDILADRAIPMEERQALLDEILPVLLDVAVPDEEAGARLRGELPVVRRQGPVHLHPRLGSVLHLRHQGHRGHPPRGAVRAGRHHGQCHRPADHRARHRYARRDLGQLCSVRPGRPAAVAPDA
ncbi:hypothetical protein GCM10010517_45000 [Streptosporangium fragile]|uniref:DUF4158 domain-containing protein n=1 Tax=Streptosporangium fragile TaxID=46186 RepID=A0ABN3W1E7_9ACTN